MRFLSTLYLHRPNEIRLSPTSNDQDRPTRLAGPMNVAEPRKFQCVIAYKISDLIMSSTTEQICRKAGARFVSAEKIDSLSESSIYSPERVLIVCDLVPLGGAIEALLKFARANGYAVMGYYPHVRTDVGKLAKERGVDYLTPRSGFRRRLEMILMLHQ